MCKHLWGWLLHGSGHLCKMLTHMHTMCVSHELYGLCKRTAITKWWMPNNVRSRVSYVIKPFQMHFDAAEMMGSSDGSSLAFAFLTQCMHACVCVSVCERTVISHQVLCSVLIFRQCHFTVQNDSNFLSIHTIVLRRCVRVLLIMFACLWIFGCDSVTMRHTWSSTLSHITTNKCTHNIVNAWPSPKHPGKLKQCNKTNKLTNVEWHILNFG